MIGSFFRWVGNTEPRGLIKPTHGLRPRGLLLTVAICSILLFAGTGWGATYYVSVDGGGDCSDASHPCSFQQALDNATKDGEDSTIIVASGNYILASTLNYSGNDGTLTIQAQDPNNRPVLDGNNTVRVMEITESRADVVINGFIFKNGSAMNTDRGAGLYYYCVASIKIINSKFYNNTSKNSYGGGAYIFTGGNVTLTNSTFENNNSNSYGGGAYIYAGSSVTLTNSTFENNNSTNLGGGAYIRAGSSVTLTNSTFENNNSTNSGGGGAYISGGSSVTLTNSTFENNNNKSNGLGGGAYIRAGSSVTLTNSTFENNNSTNLGGGAYIYAGSSVTLTNSTFENNNSNSYGGGAYIEAGSSGNINVNDSTFSQNNADKGGGIYADLYNATANIINNSFYKNTAASGDSGGGIYASLGTENDNLNLYNNILWENDAGNSGNDAYVRVSGGSQNVYNNDFSCNDFDGNSDCLVVNNPTNYNYGGNISQDPLFADPDNGDLHLTSGSPCIDKGNNDAPEIPKTDFEGDKRILDGDGDGNAIVDIGADEYKPQEESQPSLPTVSPPTGLTASAEGGCGAGCVAGVKLSWNAVKGADGYLIYNADANQLWKWVKDGTATSYTFNNLPCGQTFHFYIKTHSSYGNSQPSKTVAIETPACSGSGGTGSAVNLVWPQDNGAISYNDFDAADYLVVFAWNQVENAKGYLLSLSLEDGSGKPVTGQVVFSGSNGLIEAGNLAGIYFALDKAGWNSLVPYTVTWQVSALSDPNDLSSILGTSPKASFTFNPAP